MIQLDALKEINVMKIKVKGTDSLINTSMANLLAYELANRIEITDRSQNIVEIQGKLRGIKDEIKKTKVQLEEAQKQLKLIPEKQVVKQSLGENPLLSSIIKESTNSSTSSIAEVEMFGESINPAYTTVQEQVATLSISLSALLSDEKNINDRIQEYKDRIQLLENQIEVEKLNGKSSNRLLDGYQAAFISPAIQSTEPVSPNKILNVIIAAFVGGS